MQQKNVRLLIIPLISLSIFIILIFGAAYAYFIANTSMNTSNYQITMPEITTLLCTKTDCSITVTPAMMTNTNTSDTAKTSSNCSLNCTCSGTPGAVCDYNVRLIEMVTEYTPSTGLGSNKEFTAKVTNSSNCTIQNSSNIETQVNTLRDKIVSNCTLTVPAGGSVSANVKVEFKWYNLDLNQDNHIQKRYIYQLTNDNQTYTVTFDANGGTVGTTSKQVVYGDAYGELPEPTWAGHTFKGWNGKNKFNEEDYNEIGEYTVLATSYYWADIVLKPNTTYKVSVIRYGGFDGKANTVIIAPQRSPSNSSQWSAITHNSYPNKTFTDYIYTTSSNGLLYLGRWNSFEQSTMDFIWDKTDLQIEEGTEPTLYEPYFVTETTKVSQNHDHVLTAIWE